MAAYYQMKDGNLVRVNGMVDVGTCYKNADSMTVHEAIRINAYQKDESAQPEKRDGFISAISGYELVDNRWSPIYSYSTIAITEEDYNSALEEHLRSERVARGYDTREPSLYANSRNPRWKQDAIDWIDHVDDVMAYGLEIINTYRQTQQVPTLEDFKMSLPRINWTIPDSV